MVKKKTATTYDQQLALLRERGAVIDDEDFCRQKLSELNYYRFTAYFLPFRQADGSYLPGTSFLRVYNIYEFDRKLRGLLFSAIEEVEIFFRARLAYFHALKYGAEGYLDPANFSASYRKEQFHDSIDRVIRNNEKALFIRHRLTQYQEIFPIWAIIELFTLGMLSRFFSDMKISDKNKLTQELYAGSVTTKEAASWLHCMTNLRNICAHYGRLYFRLFPATPAGLDPLPDAVKQRLWGAVLALKGLYPDPVKWKTTFLPSLLALFEQYEKDIDLYHIAFPKDWAARLALPLK